MKYINFDDSFLEVINPKNNLKNGGMLYRVPSSIKDGFNFEYLLFIPNDIKDHTILVLEGINYDLDNEIEQLYEEFKSFKDNIHYVNSKTSYPIIFSIYEFISYLRKNSGMMFKRPYFIIEYITSFIFWSKNNICI